MTITTLKLKGRLGSAAAAKLETGFATEAGAITEKGDKAIIDLQDLVYISSLGIRMLVLAIKQFHKRGVEFATVRPRDNAANELLISVDLASHLNMVEDAEAAHAQAHQIW
ncbi:MAG: STAS domain-containing protein [Planctomycetota bacterium]